jgi:hypothetical protein
MGSKARRGETRHFSIGATKTQAKMLKNVEVRSGLCDLACFFVYEKQRGASLDRQRKLPHGL